jgi:peptide/nickel transport system ATP-binding protein
MSSSPVLDVQGLTVEIGGVEIVEGLSFSLEPGQVMAIVGESGCGKSLSALALMRLLPKVATITKGSMRLKGQELIGISERRMRKIRGNDLSMIFQEAGSALDPLMTIGDQIVEAVMAHQNISGEKARQKALNMLEVVGIPEPGLRLKQYPFELSGGMCQRIMIASALICEPRVLIADEPTTALDVTIQAQILELMRSMSQKTGAAVMLITHDLGVVADMADRVAVMYAGRVVEQGGVMDIFQRARHPYTKMLLKSIPRIDGVPKKELHIIPGVVPDAKHWPTGCRFNTRCPLADDECSQKVPPLESADGGDYLVACWHQAQVNGL